MSRSDLFSKYTEIYRKAQAKEIVPEGPFVRQFTDIPTLGLDIGVFFKSRREKDPKQVHFGSPISPEISKHEGLLEAERKTYLSRTIVENTKGLQYLRIVMAAGELCETVEERMRFMKRCQRIIDVFIRKARNVVYFGDFSAFRFDKSITTLDSFLSKTLKMDEVSVEAASIPFLMAEPEYVLLTGGEIVVIDDEPRVQHSVFHLVGGVGYTFDKKVGAVDEGRLFKTGADMADIGITEAFMDEMMSRISEDFQNKIHSVLFSDIWKRSDAKPLGINVGNELLIKMAPSSEIWSGVFEIYVKPPT
ncbi:hypothetical protein EU538_00645 [Candidatus Thorarchaeota archaeon]|nr:MAG: hypothetical protein EU538_00645 [Candidatus Thorarchaeota archaeon]